MPTVWFSLKKSMHCRPKPSDVHDPNSRRHLSTILTRKAARYGCSAGRSGCSRSIANLKDVIHGSKRHIEKPPSYSPRSIGSSEFLNPITHEVILSNSKCEFKISGFEVAGKGEPGSSSTFVGNLRPGTPGPGGNLAMHYFNQSLRNSSSSSRKFPFVVSEREGSGAVDSEKFGSSRINCGIRSSLEIDSNGNGIGNGNGFSRISCHKCGEQFSKWEAAEEHHLSNHAVTELVEGDSARKIVEIICQTSLLKSENHSSRIERVLKVHNMQKTLAQFEDYRELVKIKASKLQKKHPRCLADGNELLRFHATILACSLGHGSSSLCRSEKCCVCRIIRNGFLEKEMKEGIGVFTTSTSERALESIEIVEENSSLRKALIVCRVVAGRVHRQLENIQEISGQTGFDSLAGKVGLYSNIEELYLLNPKALLPCFVVICKA